MIRAPYRQATGKNGLMMPTHQLDAIDLRILAALQSDARMSNVELAGRVQITAPPTLRRTKTLETSGYILGYHAVLDAKKLGFEVSAFVFVGLASQSDREVKLFEETVLRWPLVRECHALSGEIDFLLKCVARDLKELQAFVTQTILTAHNVETVKTAFAIGVTKDEPDVPLPLVSVPKPAAAARKLRLPPLPR